MAPAPEAPSGLAARIEKNWYGSALGNLWLLPLWALFALISRLRRWYYYLVPAQANTVPVLVVGNLAIGGTGKTPLITLLSELATRQNIRIGVVSRGYGGKSEVYPLTVDADTPVAECGDEPALLAGRGIDVVVDPERSRAVDALAGKVDLVLADDGLQHYAMARDAEIVISDVTRGFGNGWLLPVGPLREPVSRLKSIDLHLVNGKDFSIAAESLVLAGRDLNLAELKGMKLHAVAGIGNPQRFFTTLRSLGADIIEHPFPDHHAFQAADITFNDDLPVVMTEKDWVKCKNFHLPRTGFLQVTAKPTAATEQKLIHLISTLVKHHG